MALATIIISMKARMELRVIYSTLSHLKRQVTKEHPKLHHCDGQSKSNSIKCSPWLFEKFKIDMFMTIKWATDKNKDFNEKRTWHFQCDCRVYLIFRYSRYSCSRNAHDLDRYRRSIPWSIADMLIESTWYSIWWQLYCAPKLSPFQRHTQLKFAWSLRIGKFQMYISNTSGRWSVSSGAA